MNDIHEAAPSDADFSHRVRLLWRSTDLLPVLFSRLEKRQARNAASAEESELELLAEYIHHTVSRHNAAALSSLLETDPSHCFDETTPETRLKLSALLAPLSLQDSAAARYILEHLLPHVQQPNEHIICCRIILNGLKQGIEFDTATGNGLSFISGDIAAILARRNWDDQQQSFLKELGDQLILSNDPSLDQWLRWELSPIFEKALQESKEQGGEIAESKLPCLLRCLMAAGGTCASEYLLPVEWKDHAEGQLHLQEAYLEQCLLQTDLKRAIEDSLPPKVDLSRGGKESQWDKNDIGTIHALLALHHAARGSSGSREGASQNWSCLLSGSALRQLLNDLSAQMDSETTDRLELDRAVVAEALWIAATVRLSLNKDLLPCLHGALQLVAKAKDRFTEDQGRVMRSEIWPVISSFAQQWPEGQHVSLFQKCLALFPETERTSLVSECPLVDGPKAKSLLRAAERFPVTAFLTLTLLEHLSSTDSSPSHRKIALSVLLSVERIVRHSRAGIAAEVCRSDNPFPGVTEGLLSDVLLSDRCQDVAVEILEAVLRVWMQMKQEDALIRAAFISTCDQAMLSRPSSPWPESLKQWLGIGTRNTAHASLFQIQEAVRATQVWKRFSEMASKLLQQKPEPVQVTALLCVFISCSIHCTQWATPESLDSRYWTAELHETSLANCIFLGQVIQWAHKKGTDEAETHLLRLAAEKAEALLDAMEPASKQDFLQIRAPLETILNRPLGTHSESEPLEGLSVEREAPLWMSLWWEKRGTEVASPERRPSQSCRLSQDAIGTVSKSYVYRVDAPTETPPCLDLREWFDDEAAPKKRTRRRSHPFVEACIRESGATHVAERDLKALEDFIVPSEGRDYDETFRQKYRWVKK